MKGIIAILSGLVLLLAVWLSPGTAAAMPCQVASGCPCCANACACAAADSDATPDSPSPLPASSRGLTSDLPVVMLPARVFAVAPSIPTVVQPGSPSLSFPAAEPLFQRLCVRLL